MAKPTYILVLLLILTVSSCQSLEQLSIDYMNPAEVSFPAVLRKVAIVNNTSSTPDNKLISEEKERNEEDEMYAVAYSNGKANITVESLANAIAAQNYFDEVVICDSALRAKDLMPRENTLSMSEVDELTADLNVDFIISLENLQIKATKKISYFPLWNAYRGTVDAKVFPSIKVYIPGRKNPMVAINPNDSIFWEEFGSSPTQVLSRLINDTQIVDEASDFAGSMPVTYLLPYWKTAYRYIYSNGSVNMRDAAVYVREDNWDKAQKLWEQEYQTSKRDKKKMRAAFNLAVCYEMTDSLEKAVKWAKEAKELAKKVDKTDKKEKLNEDTASNYVLTTAYLIKLKERMGGLARLREQMDRFKDDF